jgi:hypothetical protein
MADKYLSEQAIDELFTYRRWSAEEVEHYRPLREEAKKLAHHINETTPDCPQKTRAINALHEAVYLINTAATLHPLKEESHG